MFQVIRFDRVGIVLCAGVLALFLNACVAGQPLALAPAAAPTPIVGEPVVSVSQPVEPGERIGISVRVDSVPGVAIIYEWSVFAGTILEGQGTNAITYEAPAEPDTYGIRVKVSTQDAIIERSSFVTVLEVQTLESIPASIPTAALTPVNTPTQLSVATPIPDVIATRATPQPSFSGYCFGICWQYDEGARTMTWIGPIDGREDIWQGDSTSLSRIRSGWTAIFGPVSVPGEIEACILILSGQMIFNTCDGMKSPYPAEANRLYQATSENPDVGGFRWKPAKGYGYRAN